MATTITVRGTDLSKHADYCESQTPDGSLIAVKANRTMRWKSPDGDLQIEFTGDSPFKSDHKKLKKVKKNELTPDEETKDVKQIANFSYTATVFLPSGAVSADPTLEVDPDPGPKPPAKKTKKKVKKSPK